MTRPPPSVLVVFAGFAGACDGGARDGGVGPEPIRLPEAVAAFEDEVSPSLWEACREGRPEGGGTAPLEAGNPCMAPVLALAEALGTPPGAEPRPWEERKPALLDWSRIEDWSAPETAEELGWRLREAIFAEAIGETLAEATAAVSLGPAGAGGWREVRIDHDVAGRVEGVLFEPPGEVAGASGGGRGVLMLHGHEALGPRYDEGGIAQWALEYGAAEMAGAGFTVLAMASRAYVSPHEPSLARELLETTGVPLVSFQIAEDLLALSLLRALGADPPAVFGHSGGAHRARTLVAAGAEVSAFAVDEAFQAADLWPPDPADPEAPPLPHCTTVPRALALEAAMNDPALAAAPILEVPYHAEETLASGALQLPEAVLLSILEHFDRPSP